MNLDRKSRLANTIAQIKQRQRMLDYAGIKRNRLRPLPKQLHPDGVKLHYFQLLKPMLKEMERLVSNAILPKLEQWEKEAGTWKMDSAGSEANSLVDAASRDFFHEFSNQRLAKLSDSIAKATSDFQREQIYKQIRSQVGVDLFLAEPWLPHEMEAFTAKNVALIKSVPQRFFSEIESGVVNSVQKGQRPSAIATEFEQRFGVAESRALLIAKDQVGKFFGQLNVKRQQEVGIEKGFWQSMDDERVRPSHTEAEEKYGEGTDGFALSEPPTVDDEEVLPGEPILCRCQTMPDFHGVVDALS